MAANNVGKEYKRVFMVMENGKQDCVALEEPLVQQISNGDQELALKIMKAYNENARPAGESLVVSIIVPEVGPLPASSPTPTLSATVCDTSSEESQCKSNQSQVHQWKESEERLLIDKRASLDDKFNQTKSHNVLWNQIQTEMEKEGVQVSAQQIKDKWKNLKRKYMEIVDLNGKTGNCRNTCKYFDIFSQLYGTKASTKPSFVLDTSNTESAASEVNVENEVNCVPCNSNGSVPKVVQSKENVNKRKVTSKTVNSPRNKVVKLLECIEKKNEDFNEFVKKQEEQKMKRFDRFLDLFEKSLDSK